MYLNAFFQVSSARPDHAEAALLLQPAEGVVIGNAGGDAHPAGLGTGTPLCGLDQAVGPDHSWVWAKRVFQSVSCESRAPKHKVRHQDKTFSPSLGKVREDSAPGGRITTVTERQVPLTGKGWANHRVVLGLIAHPLLAAFPRQLDPPREGAVRAGQADVHATQGHAAHRPVQASALVLAAALERLSTPVDRSSKDAGGTIFS